jgi:hypothetical protein
MNIDQYAKGQQNTKKTKYEQREQECEFNYQFAK